MFSIAKEDIAEAISEGVSAEEVSRLQTLWSRKEVLCSEIQTAFANTRLGSGIGLLEAAEWDMCVDPAKPRAARIRDERHSWHSILDSDIERNGDCQVLCFTDAKGFRFLIPALMLAELNTYNIQNGTTIHLSNFRSHRDSASLLDIRQVEVIIGYLELYRDNPYESWAHQEICMSLSNFWEPLRNRLELQSG